MRPFNCPHVSDVVHIGEQYQGMQSKTKAEDTHQLLAAFRLQKQHRAHLEQPTPGKVQQELWILSTNCSAQQIHFTK